MQFQKKPAIIKVTIKYLYLIDDILIIQIHTDVNTVKGVSGMAIQIKPKMDYSSLFSGMNTMGTGVGSSMSTFLADYASIKSGSYAKLMKAYYGKNGSNVSDIVKDNNIKNKVDSDKTIASVKSSAESLKSSADELLQRGSKSVFNTKEDGIYDTDAIYDKVSQFVKDYNGIINSTKDVSNSSIANTSKNLVSSTNMNEKLLGKIGITIGSDNKLTIDENSFKKADMSKVKSLFHGNGSYAYNVSTKSSMMTMNAERAAKKMSGFYASNAKYANNYNTGNIYSSFF